MKNINTDLKYIISLWIIIILSLIPTYAHHGGLLIDCGREAYYPTQILLGKVLYKDIFNIYGPFSYLFNTLLFKIFGINLNVLYIAGCACAFSIVSLTYILARRFLSEFVSFSVAFLLIAIGVFNTLLFNFVFTYSYAMLYGTVAFLASVIFLLKYQSDQDKTNYLYLSSFFAGLCITNKYEFIPYLLAFVYAIFKTKRLDIKQNLITVFAFLLSPLICFSVLFMQGLSLKDLVYTASLIDTMSKTKTLKYFYQYSGVFFTKRTIPLMCAKFIDTMIPIALLISYFKMKKNFWRYILLLIAIIWVFVSTTINSYVFLPMMITIWFALDFKKIKDDIPLMILILSTILGSIKVYSGFMVLSYGSFFAGFIFITILALISKHLNDEKINKALGTYIILASIIFYLICANSLNLKNFQLKTGRGKLYYFEQYSAPTLDLINYINKYTKKTDTVVILPEGAMVNFLTDRPSDNFYTSLIPLYVETFGEDKIIDHFKKSKPEYIVFNNWDSSDYYLKYICQDYAQSLCNFVAQNYTKEKTIGSSFKYLIFKRK